MANVPTFEEMRMRLLPVWEKEENKSTILWAGIFGSVGRGRTHEKSDVDIVLVMHEGYSGEPVDLEEDLKTACGIDVSYVPIWRYPAHGSWMRRLIRIEALLSGRTVFGDRRDVEHLRKEGIAWLSEAEAHYNEIGDNVAIMKSCVAQAQNLEAFTSPACQSLRRECLEALQNTLRLLDLSGADPKRSMVVAYAFDHATKIRKSLVSQTPQDLENGAAPIWTEIWKRLQPRNQAMWCWDVGVKCDYLPHIRASANLAERFETGGVVDDSLYVDIVR